MLFCPLGSCTLMQSFLALGLWTLWTNEFFVVSGCGCGVGCLVTHLTLSAEGSERHAF